MMGPGQRKKKNYFKTFLLLLSFLLKFEVFVHVYNECR